MGEKASESGGKSEDQPFSENMSEALDGRVSGESRFYGIKNEKGCIAVTLFLDNVCLVRVLLYKFGKGDGLS